jgi:hypothetical protein
VIFEDEGDLRLPLVLGTSWTRWGGQKIAAPGQHRKGYAFGALVWNTGTTRFRVAPRKTSAHFLQFLKQVH